MDFASDRPPWLFYGVGAIIIVIGIAIAFIDRDPAIIFEDPVFSLLLVIIGAGVGYFGWQNRDRPESRTISNDRY